MPRRRTAVPYRCIRLQCITKPLRFQPKIVFFQIKIPLSPAVAASIFRGNVQKTYFFIRLPSRVFRPFYGKSRGFSACFPPFAAKLCTFLYIRAITKNHNLPIISPFLFFEIKFYSPQTPVFSLFSPVFHPAPPVSLLFHQILSLISGFLCSRQLAHNLINYKGTLWTCLDIFQGAA